MNGTTPFYQLVEHPWSTAPPAGASTRASVVASSGSSLSVPEVKHDAALACGISKAYLIGGQDTAAQSATGMPGPCTDAYEFAFTTRSWSALPPLPVPVTQAKAVAVDDEFVFVVGGWLGDAYSGAVWLLAPCEHPALLPPPEEGTTGAAAAETGAASSSAAGAAQAGTKADKKPRNKDVGESKLCWRLLQPALDVHGRARDSPCARVGHSVVKAVPPRTSTTASRDGAPRRLEDSVLYLFGGFDGHEWLNDLWRLRVGLSLQRREAIWERLPVNTLGAMSAPLPRSDAAVAFDAVLQRLYVCFGRSRAAVLNDVWELDLTTHEWRALTTAGTVVARGGAVAVVPDGLNLYVLAGEGETQQCIPQLLRLSLLDYKWHLLAPVAAQKLLAGRHGFVATGGAPGERGCLLFGGAGSAGALVELALDPIHVTDAPTKRK